MVVRVKIPSFIGAAAVTFWPFIIIDKRLNIISESLIRHEMVHLEQQRKWAIYGLGIGLLAWYFIYLFCLPVMFNRFRRKWETEAFKAQGFQEEKIVEILKKKPYYLK